MSTTLSLIILNYRSAALCAECLAALEKFPPKASYEILLVDNHSEDGSVAYLQKNWGQRLPIRFFELAENKGYGAGNNAGVAASSGEFIAIMNPDIRVQENTIDELLSFLQEYPTTGLIAPKLLLPDGSVQDSFRRFPSIIDLILKRIALHRKLFQKRLRRFLMWDMNFEKPQRVDWIVGAFFVMKRTTWNKVAGFDERYFLFLEDTDLCRKLWEKNQEVIFYPKVAAEHAHTRLSETNHFRDIFRKKTVRIHIWSAVQYFWKWLGKKYPEYEGRND